MNVRMYETSRDTARNISTLKGDGVRFVGPNEGDMACGEFGPGRMSEPLEIVEAIAAALADGPLRGKRVLVTSGADARADRPGALYRQPVVGGAGHGDCRRRWRRWGPRWCSSPARPRRRGPQGCRGGRGGKRRRDAGRGGGGAAGRCRRFLPPPWRIGGSRGRRLEDQETGKGKLPVLEFAENPDILKTVSQMKKGSARAGGGVCRRNR